MGRINCPNPLAECKSRIFNLVCRLKVEELPHRLKFFCKMLTQIPAFIRVPTPLDYCGWIESIPWFCVWLSANEVGRTKIDLTTAEGKSPLLSLSPLHLGLTFCGHRSFLCYPNLHKLYQYNFRSVKTNASVTFQ